MGVRLPAEYQEVEWIGSNNDAYLVIKNAVGLPEAANLKVKTTVLWKYVITRQLHGRNGRCYFGVTDGYYQNTQTGAAHTQIEAVANEWASVEWSRNDSVCTLKVGSNIDITNSTISATDPMSFALFALGDRSLGCYCALKETQVEIGSEQFDLIPCYRKQDSKPGMYDLASDTFFVNRGSGEFDIGPDVIDSISPWLVAWRRMLMKAPLNTAPKIIAYDKRYVQGGSLQASAGNCATEIYHYQPSSSARNLYSYGTNYYTLVYKNNGTTYMDWWAMATHQAPGKWGVLNANSDGIGITLVTDMLDVCYAYIVETGEILFAGKESIYYGHKNISEVQ